MNNKMTFNAEVLKELEELRNFVKNNAEIKTFEGKTAYYKTEYDKSEYKSEFEKKFDYIGMFLCQGSTTYYMCKAGLIENYLMGDKTLLKDDGSIDYANENYYKEMKCPNLKINDYDIYIFYKGINDRPLWRNARMTIQKEEGFNGKKMDIIKKAIQKGIVDSAHPGEDVIREYIKHKTLGYHLSKRPIIMLEPEIKVIWHGQKGKYPFESVENDYSPTDTAELYGKD